MRLQGHLTRTLRNPSRISPTSRTSYSIRHAPFSGSLTSHARGCAVRCSASTVETAAPATASNAQMKREFKPKTRIVELARTEDGKAVHVGETVELRGWVRTVRNQKQFCFMQVGCGCWNKEGY